MSSASRPEPVETRLGITKVKGPPHHETRLAHLASPFGRDRFGRSAERFARAFGTPQFIVAQTLIVLLWIALNAVALTFRWDPYPFILLNLGFSLQAAYAAPLILLAQTREADRDRVRAKTDTRHRERLAQQALAQERETQAMTARLQVLLEANTRLTEEVHRLTSEIYSRFATPKRFEIADRVS
jgi:uncharacterized membrane protein